MIKRFVFIFLSLFIVHATFGQEYKRVQVTLRDGQVDKGKNGFISDGAFTFVTGNMQKTYDLTDVNIIQAKEGKAGKWALYSGGGCLALCAISGLVTGSEGLEEIGATTGQFIAGSLIWTGIFAGAGALIGGLSDPWEIVYSRSTSSLWKNLDINLGSDQYAKINLILTYKFPYKAY